LPPHRKHVKEEQLVKPRPGIKLDDVFGNMPAPRVHVEPITQPLEHVGVDTCTAAARALMLKFNAIDMSVGEERMTLVYSSCLAMGCDECKAIRRKQRRAAYTCPQLYQEKKETRTFEDRLAIMKGIAEDTGEWVYLGKGNYGITFKHKSTGYAVKFTGYYYGGMDDYLKFAKLAQQNTHNPFFPRIHAFEESTTMNQSYHKPGMEMVYFCVLDCLQEEYGDRYTYIKECAADMVQGAGCRLNKIMEDAVKKFSPVGIGYLMELREILRSTGKHFDLHSGNWMFTKDGQLVCTDPWI
jgi:hypothetical protein